MSLILPILLKDRTECYDCISKPTPKTFPVCTIRATPSEPIHCIVWGKSYLLPCVQSFSAFRKVPSGLIGCSLHDRDRKLFGEDDEAEDEQELEKAKATDQDGMHNSICGQNVTIGS